MYLLTRRTSRYKIDFKFIISYIDRGHNVKIISTPNEYFEYTLIYIEHELDSKNTSWDRMCEQVDDIILEYNDCLQHLFSKLGSGGQLFKYTYDKEPELFYNWEDKKIRLWERCALIKVHDKTN